MQYITPSVLFALLTLTLVFLFLFHYVQAAQTVPTGLEWVRQGGSRLTFAGKCHPMEKRDRLPVLLITLIYAAPAFFQLL